MKKKEETWLDHELCDPLPIQIRYVDHCRSLYCIDSVTVSDLNW